MAMSRRDDLIEEVGSLLVQGKITKLIDQKKRGLSVELELAHEGMIDLGSQQVIQHIHSGSEQYTLVGLTGTPADDFGQVGFAHAGIADNADTGTLA